MAKDPLEQAIEEGKSPIHGYDITRGIPNVEYEAPKKKKKGWPSRLARSMVYAKRKARESYYGPETYLHETPAQRQARVAKEEE